MADVPFLPPVLLVCVALGGAIGFLLAWLLRGRALVEARLRLAAADGELSSIRGALGAEREREDSERSLASMLEPLREGLEGLRRSAEQAGRERTVAETTLTTQIAAVQQRYQSLEQATSQIAGALARGQTRGQWGEMQLEGILAHAGLLEGVHYVRQDSRCDAEGVQTRPDLSVLLPGGGEILIDAKFPFDAYWQAIAATDSAERDLLMRKHAADVLARARELSTKRYHDSTRSPEFVVMFLPLESLLAASLEADGLLLERTFERKVILASPTTMLALLRTVAFGYQRQLMADNAEEIKRASAEMLARLGVLVEHLDGMRRGLDQAVRGYNRFVGSFDSQAMRQARRLNELGVDSGRALDAPDPIDVALRETSALTT